MIRHTTILLLSLTLASCSWVDRTGVQGTTSVDPIVATPDPDPIVDPEPEPEPEPVVDPIPEPEPEPEPEPDTLFPQGIWVLRDSTPLDLEGSIITINADKHITTYVSSIEQPTAADDDQCWMHQPHDDNTNTDYVYDSTSSQFLLSDTTNLQGDYDQIMLTQKLYDVQGNLISTQISKGMLLSINNEDDDIFDDYNLLDVCDERDVTQLVDISTMNGYMYPIRTGDGNTYVLFNTSPVLHVASYIFECDPVVYQGSIRLTKSTAVNTWMISPAIQISNVGEYSSYVSAVSIDPVTFDAVFHYSFPFLGDDTLVPLTPIQPILNVRLNTIASGADCYD